MRYSAALIVMLLWAAADAHAQQTVSEVVNFLVTNQAVNTADFERDQAAAEAARDTITRALLINLTSVPLATSSSGFLYKLNPQLGTVERATESFGSFFVERALTAGQGRASFGVSASSSAFDSLDGDNLRNGTLLTVANRFRDEPAPFDTESLTLKIRTSTMTLFASVGVTDRLEFGGAVPFVRLALDGSRVNVYRGTTSLQASATASASGIGDVALRAKYTLVALSGGGLAVAGEVRLPTGDEENLLGAGSVAYRVMGVGSLEHGPFSLHGNGGLVRGGVSDEVTFGGAAAIAVQPRVTISGEFIGRWVSELHDVSLVAFAHPTSSGVDTLRLLPGAGPTTLAQAVAGVKWNVNGTLVVGGHLMFPLVKRGLTAPITPTLGIEYAF